MHLRSRLCAAALLAALCCPARSVRLSRHSLLRTAVGCVAAAAPPPAFAVERVESNDVPICYDASFKEIPCRPMFEQIFEDDVAPDQWKKGFGAPAANPGMVTVRRGSGEAYIEGKNANAPLRTYLPGEGAPTAPTDAQAPRASFTPSTANPLTLNPPRATDRRRRSSAHRRRSRSTSTTWSESSSQLSPGSTLPSAASSSRQRPSRRPEWGPCLRRSLAHPFLARSRDYWR